MRLHGTLIYRKDEILENHPLRLLELRPLIETALLREMTVLYSLNGTEYCMRENEAVRRKQAERGSYHQSAGEGRGMGKPVGG